MRTNKIIMSAMVLAMLTFTGCSKSEEPKNVQEAENTEQPEVNWMGELPSEVPEQDTTKEEETQSPDDNVEADYDYEKLADGIRIVGCNLKAEKIVIPEEIDGNKVLELGDLEGTTYSPFSGNRTLKEVVIPDSVKIIGREAFMGCENLENVEFGKGLEEIGQEAFILCKSLKSVKLNEGIKKLGLGAFSGNDELEKVELPASLTELGGNFFDPKVTIYAPKGSAAEKHAKEYNIALGN